MKAIETLQELQIQFDIAEKERAISDDLFRQSLSKWRLARAFVGDAPGNPYSAEYKAFQLNLYERLSGRKYAVTNEKTDFNFDQEIQWPFPYKTKSAQTVGEYLIGCGWLIKKLNLPPEAKILEIGSGYGSLTVHLAQMGYHVTCLDVSASLLDFVQARTADLPTRIKTIQGDMAVVEINEVFDTVIFHAAFHHTLEHEAMVQRLDSLLTPGGIVAFASEPIVPDDSEIVPYPWGIRLDGLSVWSICKWGWLELGFQETFFRQMLKKAGWRLHHHNLGLSGQADVWIASKKEQQHLSSPTGPINGQDLEMEVLRLRELVAAYEQGRFIRLMKWLKRK